MCNHSHTHYHEPDNQKISAYSKISPEQEELNRRWPIAVNEISELVQRIKDIRFENPQPLPDMISQEDQQLLIKTLYHALLEDDRPELKRSVVRRMANKIGDFLIGQRAPSIPVIHELLVLFPWWISHMPLSVIPDLREIALKYILNGMVLPIQTVWQDILNAPLVYLGHCVCRSSGLVNDLYKDDQVFTLLSDDTNKRLLNRFMNRYRSLVKQHGHLPDTDPKYESLCQKMSYLRKNQSSEYCIETLLEATYPCWEILPVSDKYTQSWIRSLHKNYKAHLIHKELAFELVTIQYLTRGSIFSTMKLFDTPYTICTCPTPELNGGCILTNWYYYARSNESMLPNKTGHGQRKDDSGQILPCRYFSVRATKDCIGCGCDHQKEDPRDIEHILSLANRVFQKYKRLGRLMNK